MEPNNKNIEISLFRVSTDSKYLDMIFSCPQEYYFTSLQLEMKYYDYSDKVFKSKHYDLSPALFNSDPESSSYQKKHWTIRLPLEKIQDTIVPAIYKSVLKAKEIVEEGEYSEELSSIMVCSDVNYAYRCMLHDLLDMDNLSDECAGISDEAIRKYLLLYGHLAALACGDDEVAERYFRLIGNCFSNCRPQVLDCGCNKKSVISNVKNCNCRK